MCGICGYIDFKSEGETDYLQKMVLTLKHRGPNDNGIYVRTSELAEVGLGQTRLSIVDLSINGHQPMHFNGCTLVFNGEIYNYPEIKQQLLDLGHHFFSNTDTEVILHAHAAWGKDAVHRFIGMFSYVLYNEKEFTITAYRDRAGVKPLYFYQSESLILFASELKSFHQHPRFEKEIDKQAVTLFFKLGYIPAPKSIFKNVFKLEAGHSLEYNIASKKMTIDSYWSVNTYYSKPVTKVDYRESMSEVERLLKSACEYRMVADVPVGIFLSGGYDSTAVTALLQKDRTDKLKTFTIGFEAGADETPFARKIAAYLQTDHTEMLCTAKDAEEIVLDLPYYFDEPFADNSAIPTMLVSRLARAQVTVALSADGGDEVFGGYHHYDTIVRNLHQLNIVPTLLKKSTSVLGNALGSVLPERLVSLRHKIQGFSKTILVDKSKQVNAIYEKMSYLPEFYIDKLLTDNTSTDHGIFKKDFSYFPENVSVALAIDYENFLQNDILTKVDRATMSVGLEGREPLLDHRLIEYVAGLPMAYKNDGQTSKKILKDIVHQYVPQVLLDRPKAGFTPPIYLWLKNDFSDLLEDYLCESAIKKSGLLNEKFVTFIKKSFLADKLHYSQLVYRILMFQMWFEIWMQG